MDNSPIKVSPKAVTINAPRVEIVVADSPATAGVGNIPGSVFDEARKRMEGEQKAALQRSQLDEARRTIDPEYATRRAKEEAVVTPAAEAARTVRVERDRQEWAASVDQARRGIDPEYARKAAGQDAGKAIGSVSQMAGQMGAGGGVTGALGNIGQGFASGGAAGGIAAAVKFAVDAGDKALRANIRQVSQVAEAVGSLDANKLKQVASNWLDESDKAVKQISPVAGILTGAMSESVRGFLSVNQAIKQSIESFDKYSGALSAQKAGFNVANVQRDLARANAWEGYAVNFNAADDRLSRQIDGIYNVVWPVVTTWMTGVLTQVSDGVDTAGKMLDGLLASAEGVLTSLNRMTLNLTQPQLETVQNLRELVQRAREMQQDRVQHPFVSSFRNQRMPTQAAQEEHQRNQNLDRSLRQRDNLFPGL